MTKLLPVLEKDETPIDLDLSRPFKPFSDPNPFAIGPVAGAGNYIQTHYPPENEQFLEKYFEKTYYKTNIHPPPIIPLAKRKVSFKQKVDLIFSKTTK